MTDAEATIRQSVLMGLVKCPEFATILSGSNLQQLVDDIIEEMFDKIVRWSVIEYAKELDEKEEL